jgi:hypothetical protein
MYLSGLIRIFLFLHKYDYKFELQRPAFFFIMYSWIPCTVHRGIALFFYSFS